MRYLSRRLFILGALLASSSAYSDVVLLIHGYLSNSSVWMQSGVVQTLESDGWRLAGMYSAHPDGQTHPDIKWDSIIHIGVNSNGHDSVVAAYSQDMNYVYSLRDRSTVHPIRAEHGLNPTDAIILKGILGKTNRS